MTKSSPQKSRQASAELPTVVLAYPSLAARGGAEKIIRSLSGHLSARFRVIVLSADSKRVWSTLGFPPSVRHAFVPCRSSNPLAMALSLAVLARFLITYRPAVVHTHHRRLALLFSVFKRFTPNKFRFIHTSHNVFHDGRLFRRAHCDLLVGVSGAVVENLTRFFRFNPDKVKLIYNGIDEYPETITPATENAAVIAARLTLQKGHVYLIEAWPLVLKAVPDAVLYIVGDGELREKLERRAAELGLAGRIVFKGFQSEPRTWMLKARFGILPSLWEGLPLFPLEAYSVKRAVVATAVDGTPEVVLHGRTGLLVPPKDVQKLAEAVIEMFSNPGSRERMAEEGYRLFRERFTSEVMLHRYDECYQEALG